MATHRIISLAAGVALSAVLVGCSASDEATPESSESSTSESASPSPEESTDEEPSEEEATGETAVITITDFKFDGPTAVAPGTEVMVENSDSSTHSVTSEDDSFTEVIVEADASGTFMAPMEPGEYEYVCKFHPEMTATLVVE